MHFGKGILGSVMETERITEQKFWNVF